MSERQRRMLQVIARGPWIVAVSDLLDDDFQWLEAEGYVAVIEDRIHITAKGSAALA